MKEQIRSESHEFKKNLLRDEIACYDEMLHDENLTVGQVDDILRTKEKVEAELKGLDK